ncbi:ABC-type glycerol-3-phosphate transport system, ATPase component [Gracilibacillus halophilus YIM-C55.5]|uniref:ABC-type glycerol-3-phosphate transport system, ATPase component n=1 Tax=Gracilibacillus halophilus YIM-C55.5 TaxID=1308866 RepID=N4WLW5_9BACI|nr:sn-glycerol-3-phosphate ABC transporter ATP-binding protein UgpC [Gracilibacillus halophilus]ENH97147.1 ABC-type glycerol-3-phosphate transport system, ATPase component [Gracilibacillus halophilus YIM-C55.5]
MYAVELDRVTKSFEANTPVVNHVSVKVEPGEFFVLVGPSGCGKSTLLRMIAGLESISNGSIYIDHQQANFLPPSKRNLSMVFQNYALYPHLSVEDNITFGLDVQKIKKYERKKRCSETADLLGLTDYLKRKPRHLSGGQRQRVALARAIASQTPICLMDEPLSNLDAKLRAYMRSEIRKLQRKLQMTMIYVTHDQIEAMTMGDRMMVINEGEIQQIGNPIDVYNAPSNTFVAHFIGSPPMNITPGLVQDQHIVIGNQLQIPIHMFKEDIQKQTSVLMGIRPEFISHQNVQEIGAQSLMVTIDHVEILGTETLLSFEWNETTWHAKWYGQWNVKVGDQVPVYFDHTAWCVFDQNTKSLLQGPSKKNDQQMKVGTV